jgi:AcrR family transcriptional regulator
MARKTTIEDETILDAVRAVFVEKGAQATSADFAARAGVSEGTLFNRFKTKADLMKAAMAFPPGVLPPWLSGIDQRVGIGEISQHLREIGLNGLLFFRKIVPAVALFQAAPAMHASCAGDHMQVHPGELPVRAMRALASYIEAEQALGRLRPAFPETIARTFLGALWGYAFFEVAFADHGGSPSQPPEDFVRSLVDMLLHGILPLEKETP